MPERVQQAILRRVLRRAPTLRLVCLALSLVPGGALTAQSRGPYAGELTVGVSASQPTQSAARLWNGARESQSSTRRPSFGRHLLGGAALGTLAMGGAIVIALSQSETECICGPAAFAPALAVGAATGALGGWIVYLVRSSRHDRQAQSPRPAGLTPSSGDV
jgi:hypothetical protein